MKKTHAYNSVEVPVVKGYFADKKRAGGETLTPEKTRSNRYSNV